MPALAKAQAPVGFGRTASGLILVKANIPAREIEGYCATWDPDEVGDKILPDAFNRTLEERHNKPLREKGRSDIRVLWQHEQPLGVLLSARPDDTGLLVRTRISRTTLGDDALQLVADGAVDRMSIGYMVKKSKNSMQGVRLLQDIDLWEVSFVTFPANEAAVITGVKKMGGGVPDLEFRAHTFAVGWAPETKGDIIDVNVTLETKAGKVLAGRNVERIKAIHEHCMKMAAHCKELLDEAGHGEGVEPDEEKAKRSEDAGGRGQPPNNHDVDRDKIAGKACEHCGATKADIPHMGQPDPRPESIAGLVPSFGTVDPKPDSIAGYPGPYEIPDPRPESIASSSYSAGGGYSSAAQTADDGKQPPIPLPKEMDDEGDDTAELERLASGASRPVRMFESFIPTGHSAPGTYPGGTGPYPVPVAVPYSVAASGTAAEQKGANASSSNLGDLNSYLQSMRARLAQI